jgi:predicted RNase H-like nuclease (RuvC/YqgF family)
MCKITKYDVIAQLEWFLENNDWVESLDCDNVNNHTKESLRWVIDYLNKDNERKQGVVEELERLLNWEVKCRNVNLHTGNSVPVELIKQRLKELEEGVER